MSEHDVAGVVDIERDTFTMPWSADTFSGLIARADAECFVAESAGTLMGYAVFWWAHGEAELGDIAVSARHRGRGVGTALLRSVIEDARGRGVRRVFLEVREGNADAISLYRRFGFREVGRRPDYYRQPREDALVMVRSFTPSRAR